MTEIRVAFGRRMEGVDPARVWAFVADPKNISDWAPVRSAGYLGTELPTVGHRLFLHRHRNERPENAWRCRIDEWEAGHRVRCTLETPGPAADQEVTLTVETYGTGAQPAAGIHIAYTGSVPGVAAPLYRWRIAAIERKAIREIIEALGS